MEDLLKNKWNNSISYDSYVDLLNTLVESGKTTGSVQSEAMANYTKMTAQRIKKWSKIFTLEEEVISKLSNGVKDTPRLGFLMITESWCGDAGQSLVPLKRIADAIGAEFRLILRDEHLDLMDKFLTNGGRSIPKLICFDRTSFEVLWDWGPRPMELQTWYMNEREKKNFNYEDVSKEMHLWYAKNRHQSLVSEVVQLLVKQKEKA